MRGKVTQKQWIDRFDRLTTVSTYFWNKAEEHRNGADLLWHLLESETEIISAADLGTPGRSAPARFVHSPAILLSGLAVELLLKAIARILGLQVLHSHNLAKLADHVGINLSPDEKANIDALTESIVWQAKYPAPRKREEYESATEKFKALRQKKSGALPVFNTDPNRALNRANFHRLWNRLAILYWQAKEVVYEG